MSGFTSLTPDECIARENEAMALAESWINGNRKYVATACTANVGLMAATVMCLGPSIHGPELLRYLASREYTA